MAIQDFYKYLRRRITRCGCVDSLYVIWAYSQFLQVRGFSFPDDIDKHQDFLASSRVNHLIHEWELETLAAEVILHAESGTRSMRDWSTLAGIVQKLRDLENELYGESDEADIFIEMARIMHRQISWQQFQPSSKLLYRYHRIFADPNVDAICRKVVGLPVDGLYCQAIWAFMEFGKVPALKLDGNPTCEAQHFLKFAARSLPELRTAIGSTHRLDHAYAYQVGPLRQFPLVIVQANSQQYCLCPLPTLLFWRLTSGLYFDLSKGDRDFGNALGNSFENHVGEIIAAVLTSTSLTYVKQAKYGTRQRPKATCDWLLIEGETAAAFIECKTKRIRVPAKTAMRDLTPLQDDIGVLADGIVQVYERYLEYERGAFPNLPFVPGRKSYPVVVTLEEWYLFGPRVVALLHEAVEARMRTAGIDLGLISRAPYSVLSCDEFEEAVQIINRVGLENFFQRKLSDPELRIWPYGNFIRHHFAKEWKARKPVFRKEAEALFNRLAAHASPAQKWGGRQTD